LFWEFELDLGDDSERIMERIREVVREIVEQEEDAWPEDEYWKVTLPNWLTSFMPELSKDEADHLLAITPREEWNKLPWTFGSWLEAMYERGWRWWGYETFGGKAKLVLQVTSIPPRLEAFKQILLAAGAKILSDHLN